MIYAGGWPYYFEKDQLRGGYYSEPITVGKRFARVELPDQYGDRLDLFDFYDETRPVVIVLSAQWCTECESLASWIVDDGDPEGFAARWPAGPAAVRRDDVHWITILGENSEHRPANARTARHWADAFPSKKTPVLAEDDYDTYDNCGATGLPMIVLLDPALKVSVLDPVGPDAVLAELALRFPE